MLVKFSERSAELIKFQVMSYWAAQLASWRRALTRTFLANEDRGMGGNLRRIYQWNLKHRVLRVLETFLDMSLNANWKPTQCFVLNSGTNLFRKFHIRIWISSFSSKPGRPDNPGAEPHIPTRALAGAEEQLSPSASSPRPPALAACLGLKQCSWPWSSSLCFFSSYSKENRKVLLASMALSKVGKWQTKRTRWKTDLILCELYSCAYEIESVLQKGTVSGTALGKSVSPHHSLHDLPVTFKPLSL